MKDYISKIFDFSIPSIIYLILPYLIKNFFNFFNSQYFSLMKYISLLLILIVAQVLTALLFKSKNNVLKYGVFFFISSLSIFFYGADFVNTIMQLQIELYGQQIIRTRVIFLIFVTIFYFIEYLIWFKNSEGVRFLNLVYIFLSILALCSAPLNIHFRESKYLSNRPVEVDSVKSINKPVFLVVLDEYASPSELSRVFNDSSIKDFSLNLKRKGWAIKDSFSSNEVYTINSLASLFNYNLSKNSFFDKKSDEEFVQSFFRKSRLADSLRLKGVKVINNGIFDFGTSEPLTRVYYYPKGFIERFLYNSIFPLLYSNTGDMLLSGFGSGFFSTTHHNNEVFLELAKLPDLRKSFIYCHFYMPHPPLTYGSEFAKKEINAKNYLDFWKFTNKKVSSIIDTLSIFKDYKIILTGDHGHYEKRGDTILNRKITFAAFYGFDNESLKNIQCVQDLGSLINSQFKK
jgi:hypothetical protein